MVVPASMTFSKATSSNEVVSLGYIVVIDSERLTSSMLLMLEESTVTWISTGLPSNRIEAVYTRAEFRSVGIIKGVSILEEAEAFTVLLLGLVVFLELSELLLPRRITANIIKAIIIAAITAPIRSF